MVMAESQSAQIDQPNTIEYRAISPAAIAGLVFGLLSVVALVHPLLWAVPVFGLSLSLVAFWKIRQSGGELTGHRAATAGLILSVFFGTAGMAKESYERYWFSHAARPIAEAWFSFLQHDEPSKALQLSSLPAQRRPLDEALWEYYSANKENRAELQSFVATPVPRLLLEYGKKCQVRYYETGRIEVNHDREVVELFYAVTFPEGASKKTFFVRMNIERRPLQSGGVAWRVASNLGGVRPAAMLEAN